MTDEDIKYWDPSEWRSFIEEHILHITHLSKKLLSFRSSLKDYGGRPSGKVLQEWEKGK